MELKRQFQVIVCISIVCTFLFIILPSDSFTSSWLPDTLIILENQTSPNIQLKVNHSDTRSFVVQTQKELLTAPPTTASPSFLKLTMADIKPVLRLLARSRPIKIAVYHAQSYVLKDALRYVNLSKCYHYRNCEIMNINHGYVKATIDSDAILMQGNRIPMIIPTRRDQDQAIVYWTIEAPTYLQYTNPANPRFIDYFNWTMTYRLDSDIPYLYGLVLPRDENVTVFLRQSERTGDFGHIGKYQKYMDDVTAQEQAGIKGKDYSAIYRMKDHKKSAVWLVSHCISASKREKYVDLMKPYLNIDIIGMCVNNSRGCSRSNKTCIASLQNTYKFYLAFENSICKDYITEKVFNWFKKDIIVVVRGTKHYKNHLPPETYIDADNFKQPKHLAGYLQYLGSNEKEYTKFLKRKDMYRGFDGLEMAQLAFCNLCYKLNNLETHRKPVEDLAGWWRGRSAPMCFKPQDFNNSPFTVNVTNNDVNIPNSKAMKVVANNTHETEATNETHTLV